MSNTVSFNIRVSDNGTIRNVEIDAKDLQSALNDVVKNSRAASLDVSKFGSAVKGMVAQYVSYTAALLLVGKTIKQTVTTNAQFERSNSELASVLGKTRDEVSRLTTSAKELGRTTEFTASEVTALQTSLARLGFTEEQIIAMQEPVLKFAAAVGTDLASAADFSGSALRAFGLAAGDTKHLLDVMAASTSKSALDFSKLQTSISIIGPVAHSFGLSVEDTVTFLGALSNAGFDASSASTALRNILLNLADSNGKLAKGLGHTANTFPEIIAALKECTQKGIDLNSALEMTDKRSVSAFATLINGAGSADELRKALGNCDGSLETMYHTMSDNLIGATKGLQSAWEGLMLEFQDSNGPLAEIIRQLTDLTNGTTDAIEATRGRKAAKQGPSATDAARSYVNRLWGQTGGDVDAIRAEIEASRTRLQEGSGYKPSGNSKKKEAEEEKRLIQLWVKEIQMINAAEAALQERIASEAEWQAELESSKENKGGTSGGGTGTPLSEDQEKEIKKYNKAIKEYQQSIERAVEVNSLFGVGQTELTAKLRAMESGLTSLIAKYGTNRKEIKSLIAEYKDLKKIDIPLPALNSSSLTTIAKPNSSTSAEKSDDIKAYYDTIGKAVQMNRVFGDGQSDSAASLEAMESALPGLIEKYGENDIAIQKLIHDYLTLKNTVEPATEAFIGMEKAQTALSGISSAFSSLSNVVGEGAAAWLDWGSNLLSAISQAIPQIAALTAAKKAEANANTEAAASGVAASVGSIPLVGPVMAVAAIASVIAALSAIPKFAKGGIAYGPTLGLFGEYPGASHNPEVVAPLSSLTNILGASGGGAVEFHISGRDLYGVLERRQSFMSRGR